MSYHRKIYSGVELMPGGDLQRTVQLGEFVDTTDLDAVFVGSHYMHFDTILLLSMIADRTDDTYVGTGVTNPYEVHPASLAARMATLDEISDGRAIFGIGAGDQSVLRNLGVDQESPLRRVLESITLARELWEGERVTRSGNVSVSDAHLLTGNRSIPVFVGAQGPDMIRMSAKYADGILLNASHPKDVEWASERVSEGLEERASSLGDFQFLVYMSLSVSNDLSLSRKVARNAVAYIVGGANEKILSRHNIDSRTAQDIGTFVETGQFSQAINLVTDDMIDAFSVAGTPKQVAEQIDTLMDYADGIVAGTPLGPSEEDAISLFDEIVSLQRTQ